MSFNEYYFDDRMYLKSDIIKTSHCFTSSLGGVSLGKISGLNLGFRVGDDANSVIENYGLVAKDMGFDIERCVLSKQTHTNNIRIVTEEDCGKGIVRTSDIEDTDGLITNIPNIPLVIFAADCVPVLLYDPKKRVAAAVHAGWRGSVAGIAPKCVNLMASEFNCNPDDIVAAIGPCIGPCCFEFGDEAVIYFSDKYYTQKDNGKYNIDLWSYNRDLLIDVGVNPRNIDISGVCTMCNSDKFYSYRTHRENTGRQAAVIMIENEIGN